MNNRQEIHTGQATALKSYKAKRQRGNLPAAIVFVVMVVVWVLQGLGHYKIDSGVTSFFYDLGMILAFLEALYGGH